MSLDFNNLCCEILHMIYGETVRTVAEWLLSVHSATLASIIKATKLRKNEVSDVLRVLIKFNLVSVKPGVNNPQTSEYAIHRDDVYYLFSFGSYIQIVQENLGIAAANVLERILYEGSKDASHIIVQCMRCADNKLALEDYRNGFLKLLELQYIKRKPYMKSPTNINEVPVFHLEPHEEFAQPPINLQLLSHIIAGGIVKIKDIDDNGIAWQVNHSRFHRDLRDKLIISAYKRKLNEKYALLMSIILEHMHTSSEPWFRKSSLVFTFADIKYKAEQKRQSLPADVIYYLDQYISVICEDSLGFLRKVGDGGNGQYVVDMARGFENLAYECIQNVITERFSSKAARIFRVVRQKKYIDQEDLQKEVMIPAKEAKLLTYILFQEQYLHIKVIRKPGGGSTGPARNFNFYTIKLLPVVRKLMDLCFKTLHNLLMRKDFLMEESQGLVEKAQKLGSIVSAMRERGETEEYIQEICETVTPPEREILEKSQRRLDVLSHVAISVRENIFLLQMYMYHCAYNTSNSSAPTACY